MGTPRDPRHRKPGIIYTDSRGQEYEYKLPTDDICNGWIPQARMHCQHAPGKGTDHPGEGRCYRHAGRRPTHGEHSRPDRGGRYQNHAKLGERIKAARERKDLLSVVEEVALMQAAFEAFIDKHREHDLEGDLLVEVEAHLDKLTRLKKLAHEMLTAWSDQKVARFMAYLVDVVERVTAKELGGDHPAIPRILLGVGDEAERFRA